MSLEKHAAKCKHESCPCCGLTIASVNYRYRYADGEAFVYRCDRCGFEFLRPLVLTEFTERRMESVEDAEMFHSSFLKSLHECFIIRPEIQKVRSLLGKSDFSMLDVGCVTGRISRIWADSGARVTGLEPSEARAAIAKEHGLRVLPSYVEELDTDERYDLIAIRHGVEHLEDPATILRNLAARLNPGGLLLVVVPNINCIGRKVFDTDWTWVLPWHCNFFSPKSVHTFIENCGYTIAKLFQTPSPLWYPKSFFRRFLRLGRFIGSGLVPMLLFAPLIEIGYIIGHSDNITVLARLANR